MAFANVRMARKSNRRRRNFIGQEVDEFSPPALSPDWDESTLGDIDGYGEFGKGFFKLPSFAPKKVLKRMLKPQQFIARKLYKASPKFAKKMVVMSPVGRMLARTAGIKKLQEQKAAFSKPKPQERPEEMSAEERSMQEQEAQYAKEQAAYEADIKRQEEEFAKQQEQAQFRQEQEFVEPQQTYSPPAPAYTSEPPYESTYRQPEEVSSQMIEPEPETAERQDLMLEPTGATEDGADQITHPGQREMPDWAREEFVIPSEQFIVAPEEGFAPYQIPEEGGVTPEEVMVQSEAKSMELYTPEGTDMTTEEAGFNMSSSSFEGLGVEWEKAWRKSIPKISKKALLKKPVSSTEEGFVYKKPKYYIQTEKESTMPRGSHEPKALRKVPLFMSKNVVGYGRTPFEEQVESPFLEASMSFFKPITFGKKKFRTQKRRRRIVTPGFETNASREYAPAIQNMTASMPAPISGINGFGLTTQEIVAAARKKAAPAPAVPWTESKWFKDVKAGLRMVRKEVIAPAVKKELAKRVPGAKLTPEEEAMEYGYEQPSDFKAYLPHIGLGVIFIGIAYYMSRR